MFLPSGAPSQARGFDGLEQLIARRYFLALADRRCHRLDPAAAMAVKAGYLQARNEALRNGRDMTDLAPLLDAAGSAAERVDCDAPQLNAEAASADDALRAYTAQTRLTLDVWTGDRSYPERMAWRLVQYRTDAAAGLYGPLNDTRFVVMARFQHGERPYAARLLLRDPNRQPSGLINPAPYVLSDAPPPGFSPSVSDVFMAGNISQATVNLTPVVRVNAAGFSNTGAYVGAQGPVAAIRADFPTRAFIALGRLDPREDMVVAFDFESGTRYMRFQVGDFITGLTYVNLPSPYGPLNAG